MKRKTFTDKAEAAKYQNDMTEQGHTAVMGSLGDKFRVYVETKEETETMNTLRRDGWTKGTSEGYLRRIAYEAKEAIGDALALKKSMETGEIYNDYESSIEAARILEKNKELKYASDVFNFLDNTSKYDAVMKQIIEDAFEQYDYEAKEEVAKE